jgi:hypothetical protein
VDHTLTKALPFTEASLARAIKGVTRAGLTVTGVKTDGTLIVSNAPSQAPEKAEDLKSPRRLEDYFNGNQGAATRP